MFDDLMGKSNAMQEKMQEELRSIALEHEMEGVKIIGDASGAITDISIDDKLMTVDNREMLEDLILTCIQSFNDKVSVEANKISQKMIGDMFSGGMGNLFG